MAGPDLTPDLTGNPFVEVFFDPGDLDGDATKLRIYRYSEDRTWLVRGGVDVAVGVAAIDWEVPFQTQATYRAEMFDASGASLGYTDTSVITLDVSDVWVHNPLVPTVAVNLGPHGLLDVTTVNRRPTVGSAAFTEGSITAQHTGSRRRGVVNMPLGFAVDSLDDMDTIQTMLGTYEVPQLGVLCLRTPPPARIPRTFFTSVSNPDEVGVDTQWGGERSNFFFEATEVKSPYPGIVTPLLTYDDLDAAYATYEDRDAAYATYTEQDRDYSLAGFAS